MKEKRKTYDRSFKEAAVQLSYKVGNISQALKEFEISRGLLRRWRQEYQEFGARSFCGSGNLRLNPEEEKIQVLEKKLKELELRFEILKKGSKLKKGNKYFFKEKLLLYQFIENNEKIYSIKRICEVLGVGAVGYRRWKKQIITETESRIILIKEEIAAFFFEFKQRYGSARIARELQVRGYKISKSQVSSYLSQLGLYSRVGHKLKKTDDSNHNQYIVPNVLNGQFTVEKPSKVWISDITYIKIKEGFLYLTIIMDLFDRKIIGWSLSNGMATKETTLVAWEMAISNRKIINELIFHSDRGVQYANKNFTKVLDAYKTVKRSMNRKGDHVDNAVAESFFNQLKTELIYRNKLLTEKEMQVEIFEYIETWYNKKRRHSTLKYKTIEEFNSANAKI